MLTKKILAAAIVATSFISTVHAATVNPGSWSRGAANSLYAEWDLFNTFPSDTTPDVGSANFSSGFVSTSGASFLSGGNLYGYASTGDITDLTTPVGWSIGVTGNGSGPVAGDNATVYLQLTTRGAALDSSSITLGGINAASSTLISSTSLGIGFGGSEDVWLFSWNTTGVASWNFAFSSLPHMSISVAAVDIQTSAVPVPAAAWLMGSGLIGLTAVARRRKA